MPQCYHGGSSSEGITQVTLKGDIHNRTRIARRRTFQGIFLRLGHDSRSSELPLVSDCKEFSEYIPLTRSLHEVLADLPHVLGEGCIWIDQIRINREDRNERAKDVVVMREIHKMAEMVVVWLGPWRPSMEPLSAYIQDSRLRIASAGWNLNSLIRPLCNSMHP